MLTIKQRQRHLKYLGFYTGKIDGVEGKLTKAGYLKLQKKYFTRKQDIDGLYGTNTDILLVNAYRVKVYAKNFKLEEFKCECKGYCTGYHTYLNVNVLKYIQRLRNTYGVLHITSGLRCVKYNNEVGGIKGSKHTKGKAVDFYNSKTSTLAKRKTIIDKYIKYTYASYSYCNGYGRTKWRKSKVYYPNMGSSIHIDVI